MKSIQAKTGTAENAGSDHSTFICYAPYDKPQVALAVVLEHAGDIFAKSGDMEQAMFYWQKALEKDGSNKQLKKKIKLKQYVEN